MVGNGGVVSADDFIVVCFANGVDGHFKHAQMEVCYGRERATSDDDERLHGRVLEDFGETVSWELVGREVARLARDAVGHFLKIGRLKRSAVCRDGVRREPEMVVCGGLAFAV